MQPQNYNRKQATSGDIDGFISTLTKLLEGDRLSDSTKETFKQVLCNLENTADEGEITSPENIRAWLAHALNTDNVQTAYEDKAEQEEEGKPFVIFHDEADAQQSVDSIAKGITCQGLNILADILIELRELTSAGPEESKKASEVIGYILELVFRRSKTYQQAFRLYTNRFDIIGGGDPDDHLSQFVDRLLTGEEVTAIEQ
jgi:hypothetical protein